MSTSSNTITISKLCVAVSHVNRSASVRFEALRVEGKEVKVAPNVDDIQARVKSGGIEGLHLSAIIRAFRSQLAVSAPEHEFRKWSLFCSFEGYPEGKGPSRRSVPSFLVGLPTSVTAATPMMTPAATAETTYNGHEAAADEEKPLPTLGKLLEPFFSPATVAAYSWHAKLSFVLGEDEEEERKRKTELKAATVVLSQQAAGAPPTQGSGLFGIADQPQSGLFGGGLFGNDFNNPFGVPTSAIGSPGGFGGGGGFGSGGGFGGGGGGFVYNTVGFGSGSGLFGQQQPVAAFGQPQQANLFTQQSNTALFGQPQQFGGLVTESGLFAQPSNTGFGMPPPAPMGNVFGGGYAAASAAFQF